MQNVQLIAINQLIPSKENPRGKITDASVSELAEDIKVRGVLQPLQVKPIDDKRFEIIFGHRRHAAARVAGMTEVPCIVNTKAERDTIRANQLAENIHRADVHPLDEAEAIARLLTSGRTYDHVAKLLAKPKQYIYDALKLRELTPEAQDHFRKGDFQLGHAILLSRLSPKDQKRAMHVASNGFSSAGGLFTSENTLFDKGKKEGYKARSVAEFRDWIKRHVKFDREKVDSFLFPETVAAIAQEKEKKKPKLIPITFDHMAHSDVRSAGERVYGSQSWRWADGKRGKVCDKSGLGVVVSDERQAEAVGQVCINRLCKVHFPKKAKKNTDARDAARWEKQRRDQEAAHRKEEAERAQWRRAIPEIRAAAEKAVYDLPVSRALDVACSERGIKRPSVKTADDFVRSYILASQHWDEYGADYHVPRFAKSIGLDYKAIFDKHASKPEPKKEAATKAKPAAKKRVAKKSKK